MISYNVFFQIMYREIKGSAFHVSSRTQECLVRGRVLALRVLAQDLLLPYALYIFNLILPCLFLFVVVVVPILYFQRLQVSLFVFRAHGLVYFVYLVDGLGLHPEILIVENLCCGGVGIVPVDILDRELILDIF